MMLQRVHKWMRVLVAGGRGVGSPVPQTSCRLLRPYRAATCCPSPRIPLSPLSTGQGRSHSLFISLCAEYRHVQSCPILCGPVDCSPPGSSDHGVFQARILEWVAISFSRGFSPPRDRTQVSCIAGSLFTD